MANDFEQLSPSTSTAIVKSEDNSAAAIVTLGQMAIDAFRPSVFETIVPDKEDRAAVLQFGCIVAGGFAMAGLTIVAPWAAFGGAIWTAAGGTLWARYRDARAAEKKDLADAAKDAEEREIRARHTANAEAELAKAARKRCK